MPLPCIAARAVLACLVLACLALAASASSAIAHSFEGKVSWYGAEYGQGQRHVACQGRFGGLYDPEGITAAHWTLPCGTRVRVTDLATGRSVDVTVTDRGPHPRLHRALDLSQGAARQLGTIHRGVIRARITVLGR